jgi:hypothetical protein
MPSGHAPRAKNQKVRQMETVADVFLSIIFVAALGLALVDYQSGRTKRVIIWGCIAWIAAGIGIAAKLYQHADDSDSKVSTADALLNESDRAWLTVKGATLMPDFAVGKQLRVVIRITNTGQTPAQDVIVTGDVVSRESIDLVEFKTDSLAGPAPSRMVIAPGTTGTVVISHRAPIPTQAHIDAFVQGTYTVFARGFILYRDVRGKGHRTLYCFKASGSDFKTMSELGVGMSACDRWNTAE